MLIASTINAFANGQLRSIRSVLQCWEGQSLWRHLFLAIYLQNKTGSGHPFVLRQSIPINLVVPKCQTKPVLFADKWLPFHWSTTLQLSITFEKLHFEQEKCAALLVSYFIYNMDFSNCGTRANVPHHAHLLSI